jgi:hypothetical protein
VLEGRSLYTTRELADGKDNTLEGAINVHVQIQRCWLQIAITMTTTSERLPSHHNHVTIDGRTSEKERA